MEISDFDRGWLVGFFEGEGSCGVYSYEGKGTRLVINAHSTDKDCLERVKMLIGMGSVTLNRAAGPGTKALWVWQVQNIPQGAKVCRLLYPNLMHRRQLQMKPVLDYCEGKLSCLNPT